MFQTALCSLVPLQLNTFMANLDYNLAQIPTQSSTNRRAPSASGLLDHPMDSHEGRKKRRISRSGGLLEIVKLIVLNEDPENPSANFVVQFIHQTVKKYMQLTSRVQFGGLGLTPIISGMTGDYFLLRSCEVVSDQWPGPIKRDIFSYAKRVFVTPPPSNSLLGP